jgi:hypothetical protein
MGLLSRVLHPRMEATAHCDLSCGVYDPAQAVSHLEDNVAAAAIELTPAEVTSVTDNAG